MRSSLHISCFLFSVVVTAGPGINPNPNPNFDPNTSKGTFGPFTPALQAANGATGGPKNIDVRSKQAMQLAMSNWATDTGIVSGFLNIGKDTADNQAFQGIADGAFKAEVDELAQKAVLDRVIGKDARVSIANLTLTNGVFQSVVDNLQIMALQGPAKSNLVDSINNVRCTQILPSIDTYMVVAAEYIGDNAQQRRAVRPAACTRILAQANSTAFAALPGTPNAPQGQPRGTGDGNIPGVLPACSNDANALSFGNVTNAQAPSSNAGSAANAPLSNTTTPQLGLPDFQRGGTANGNAGNTQTSPAMNGTRSAGGNATKSSAGQAAKTSASAAKKGAKKTGKAKGPKGILSALGIAKKL